MATSTTPAPAGGPAGLEVLSLLTVQRELYQRLRTLSAQQAALISDQQPEVLLHILTERQTLVNRLARINEQLAPYRRTWDATYAALPAETRKQVSTLLTDINELLRSILTTDERDTAALAARKHAVGRELSTLTGTRAAANAYARTGAAGANTPTHQG